MSEKLMNWFETIDWNAVIQTGVQWLGHIAIALLIYIAGRWVIRQLLKVTERALRLRNVDKVLSNFLRNLISAALTVLLIIMVLQQLGVQTSSLLAIIGAAGLAIGLALKDSLGNFASGVMLVILKPFRAGDFVDIGSVSGTVETVHIFNTVITTPDNREVTIPNSLITSDAIINYTARPIRRIDLVVGVAYDDNLQVASQAIEKALTQQSKLLAEPAPVVMVYELGDSSVNFAVRPWVKTDDYWSVRGPLMQSIKAELEAAGCSIPFPQRDIHLFQSPSSTTD